MTLAASSPTPSARLGRPLALVVGAALLAPTLLRPGAHGPVLCPLRRVTGVWCPTCGMTRALGWLAHGNLGESLRYHPLAAVVLIEGLLVSGVWWYRRQRRRDDPSWLHRLLVANALLVLVVWVVRLKSGSFDDLG